MESFAYGVDVPIPTKSVAVESVVYPPADANAPPPEPAHVPSARRKQPPDSWIPFAKVDVAVVDVMLSAFAERPPDMVEVAVDVALNDENVRAPSKTPLPATDRVAYGDDVLIPTLFVVKS